MSSTNVSLILSELQAARADILALKSEVSSLRAAMSSKASSVAAPATSGKRVKKAKDPNAAPRPRTPWGSFTDRIRTLLKANAYEGKALATECVQFCATLKDENADFAAWEDADILARRATWTPPDVSRGEAKHGVGWSSSPERKAKKLASANNSVVTGGGDDELDGEAPAPAPAPAPAKKERKPRAKKVASVTKAETSVVPTPAPVPAPAPPTNNIVSNAASSSNTSGGGIRPVMIDGNRYVVDMDTNHAWHRAMDSDGKPAVGADGKAVKGSWAGLFHPPTKAEDGSSVKARIESIPDPNEDELSF